MKNYLKETEGVYDDNTGIRSRRDKDKAARYEHLGMKLDRVRNCGERFHMYDLIKD